MTYEQQRAGCRPPGAIRLAHLPGDAAVSPGAARLLSTWPRSRQAAPLATIPLAAASVSRCLLSGPNRCLCKHFHEDGVGPVPPSGLAPKRDWCADRRASRDYRRRSGLEIGESHDRAVPNAANLLCGPRESLCAGCSGRARASVARRHLGRCYVLVGQMEEAPADGLAVDEAERHLVRGVAEEALAGPEHDGEDG